MPASVWVVNLVVLVAVLAADLGRRRIAAFRALLPLILAAIVAAIYVASVARRGHGLWLEVIAVGVGIVLGLFAAALMQVYTGPGGFPYSRAGFTYALLWIVIIGARLWFGYASRHTFPRQFGNWESGERVTTDVVLDSLIFLALGMLLVRAVSLLVRARRVR